MTTSSDSGIACPACLNQRTEVTDSRPQASGQSIRRRRMCANGHRFTTYELVVTRAIVVQPGVGGRAFRITPLSEWAARITAALSSGVPELIRRIAQ